MKHSIVFLFVVVLAFLIPSAGISQSLTGSPQPLQPLEKLLNPDGTVNLSTGFSGSLDPKGFTMTTGPNGEPHFTPASVAADSLWDKRFGYTNVDGNVYAVSVAGNFIYIGGSFGTVGGVACNNIAQWDGTQWHALGSGTDGDVYTIVADGLMAYVGGSFVHAGGITVNNIAVWDGVGWVALLSGLDDAVYAIARQGLKNVLVGGKFHHAVGGTAADYLAVWNGANWFAFGGTDGTVYSIATSGSEVYIGGAFTMVGMFSANHIARFDGISQWFPLSGGTNDTVYSIAINGERVYVGGAFTSPYSHFATWWTVANNWYSAGSGMNGTVRTITTNGDDIYAGGNFTQAGGVGANNIAVFHNAAWSQLGSGTNSIVSGIAFSGSDLCVGGWFTTAGGKSLEHFAQWDGSNWIERNGMNAQVLAITAIGSDVYAGGNITRAGGVPCTGSAQWDGTSWSALGYKGGNVFAFATIGSDLYAGGDFMGSVAKWNGASWSDLGTGVSGLVYALAASGTDLYVGGSFGSAGGVSVSNIAKWNGTSWSALGSGTNGPVLALAVAGGDVYAGGDFSVAGGVSASRIAKWDGTNWSALGNGLNGDAYAIATIGTDIYVGGSFGAAGGVSSPYLAKWNGTNWSAVSGGVDNIVRALAVSGTDLYVGGQFGLAGGVSAAGIAKWDGANWSALGSGTNGSVRAITVVGTELYAGGQFTTAGGKASTNFGHWSIPIPVFSVLPTSLSYGSVFVGTNKADTLKIKNLGNIPLNITTVISDHSDYSVVPGSGTVAPHDSLKFYVAFQPYTNGMKTGNIIFTHNASGSPDTVNVSGTAFDTVYYRTFMKDTLERAAYQKPIKRPKPGKPITMPNTANVVQEIYLKNPTALLIVGKANQLNPGGKVRPYVQPAKYNDVLTTLNKRDAKHMDQPRGLDFDAKWSPLKKRYKSLPATTHNNKLLGDLMALQVNIAASDGGITHGGLADLIYNDGTDNRLNDLTIDSIVRYANNLMTNWEYKSLDLYNNIDSTVRKINSAFSGSFDTISWVTGSKLVVKGVRTPGDVGYLRYNPQALPRIIPVSSPEDLIPSVFALNQNYPNPFNPTTMISYSLSVQSLVTLKVYDILGREVVTLLDKELINEGEQDVEFNASQLASGVYFYRFVATPTETEIDEDGNPIPAQQPFMCVKKMLLLK